MIEIDGDTHSTDDELARDAKRTEDIERAGFQIVRFDNNYVLSDKEGNVAESILDALASSALPAGEKKRLYEERYFSVCPSP